MKEEIDESATESLVINTESSSFEASTPEDNVEENGTSQENGELTTEISTEESDQLDIASGEIDIMETSEDENVATTTEFSTNIEAESTETVNVVDEQDLEASTPESNENIDENVTEISGSVDEEDLNEILEDKIEDLTTLASNDVDIDPIEATDAPTVLNCEGVTCQPPVGYESCSPISTSEGECCPDQYECSSSTTEGPVTVIVTTEGTVTETFIEASTESVQEESAETETQSIQDIVTETVTSIITDATNSFIPSQWCPK